MFKLLCSLSNIVLAVNVVMFFVGGIISASADHATWQTAIGQEVLGANVAVYALCAWFFTCPAFFLLGEEELARYAARPLD